MKIIQRLLELQILLMGPKAEAPETRRTAEAIRKEVPEQIMAHFDRLLARGKKGVALVYHGVCSGCQMRLASGPNAALQRADDIAICDTCGRYLLLAPEPPAPAAPPEPEKKPRAKRGRPKAAPDAAD